MMGFSGSHTANMTHDPTEYHRTQPLGNTWHVPTATAALRRPAQHPGHSSDSSQLHPHTKSHRHMASEPRALRTAAPTDTSPLRAAVLLARPLAIGQNLPHPEGSGSNPRVVRQSSHGLPPHQRVPQTSRSGDTAAGRRHGRCHGQLEITAATTRTPRLHHRGGRRSGPCVYTPAQANTLPPSRHP